MLQNCIGLCGVHAEVKEMNKNASKMLVGIEDKDYDEIEQDIVWIDNDKVSCHLRRLLIGYG